MKDLFKSFLYGLPIIFIIVLLGLSIIYFPKVMSLIIITILLVALSISFGELIKVVFGW